MTSANLTRDIISQRERERKREREIWFFSKLIFPILTILPLKKNYLSDKLEADERKKETLNMTILRYQLDQEQ